MCNKIAVKSKGTLGISGIFFLILLYLFVFQPPFFDKTIYLGVWILLFLGYALLRPRKVAVYLSLFRYEILVSIFIISASLIRDVATGEVVYSDRFFAWFIQSLIIPCLFISFAESRFTRKDWLSDKFVDCIYYVVIVAGILTLTLILFPGFDAAYKNVQVDGYYELYKDFDFRYRAYGIAENLSFTYGYILGIFAGYAFVKSGTDIRHFSVVILLLVGVLFNARIGIIPFMILSISSLMLGFNRRYFFLIVALLLVQYIVGDRYYNLLLGYFAWGMGFFRDIGGFVLGDVNNTVGVLLLDMIILPSNVYHFFFGEGLSLYGLEGGSDVGYILQLNYAGVFFLISLLFFMMWCSYRLMKAVGFRCWFFYIFIVSVFFLNLKGFLFAATPGARVIFLLYVYYIYRQHLIRESECGKGDVRIA